MRLKNILVGRRSKQRLTKSSGPLDRAGDYVRGHRPQEDVCSARELTVLSVSCLVILART